jgi:hypothetical protein
VVEGLHGTLVHVDDWVRLPESMVADTGVKTSLELPRLKNRPVRTSEGAHSAPFGDVSVLVSRIVRVEPEMVNDAVADRPLLVPLTNTVAEASVTRPKTSAVTTTAPTRNRFITQGLRLSPTRTDRSSIDDRGLLRIA